MKYPSRTGRQIVATLIVVSLGLITAAILPPRDKSESERNVPLEWGLYQILWSAEYDKQLAQEIARFATSPAYITFYRDLGRPFPKHAMDCVTGIGATTVVSLELWSWHGGRQGSYLSAINEGAYDEFLSKWAKDAKDDGRRVLLRFGFEFNGNWFTWSGDPDSYVKAWRRAHDIFRQAGATNVEWVWSPNVVSCPDALENGMHRYYPGDAYVDWVGVDGYNFGDHHDQWHKWQSFAEVFDKVLSDFSKRYAKNPIMITELGCAPGTPNQQGTWIRKAHASLEKHPQVKAVLWFNYDKRREGEPNWRIDQTADSLKAFNETFAAKTKTKPPN